MEEQQVKITQKDLSQIQKTAEEFLSSLEVSAQVSVEKSDEGVTMVLETEDTGILIGYHGETLEALQLLLSLSCAKKIGKFVRVTLEIGGYRKNRTEALEQLAKDAKERVLSTGHEVTIPSLRSWERRVIHMILKDDKDITSESVGQGRERTLVVKLREAN